MSLRRNESLLQKEAKHALIHLGIPNKSCLHPVMSDVGAGGPASAEPVARRRSDAEESRRAARSWWDEAADDYQREHADFLGDADFVWGPEGLREVDLGALGPVAGRRVLEIGCGAAQCSRWLATQGAATVAVDLSYRQLQHARRLDGEAALRVPVAQADALALPFADAAFDAAFASYGAVQFVADVHRLFAAVARVVRPGGRWAFSVTHPVRWAFPDDPGPGGLTATRSYFDRRAYVEQDERGHATYVEHHRTLGDLVGALTATGWSVRELIEPEWPQSNEQVWGGWSPLRGRVLPGTALFVCASPQRAPDRG
jgi:SAM-dependent methyltransferase